MEQKSLGRAGSGQCKADADKILVSDFDGTMTRHDFYRLVLDEVLPHDVHDYWTEYCAGTITHFEALQGYFAEIRAGEERILQILEKMELDPQLGAAMESLADAGWRVVVTSAGCGWYIQRLLGAAGVDLEVHSNPGRFESGRGLLMELPTDSAFFSPTIGVDKAGVVRNYLGRSRVVVFAGDGFPDVEAARLVEPRWRFARADLAAALRSEGLPFRPFERWSDVAAALLREEA